ncbi:hypothetical protein ACPUVO_15460 [Pseudocolwellia sp. HL-MZ19]|uniref:hypothetical protein n=1 Tax=unclassified Pseudocolwellia TaxID=2848178 RepID=UPI003CF21A68
MKRANNLLLLSTSVLFLSACGGSGSDSSNSANTPISSTTTSTIPLSENDINVFDDNVSINQATELFLYFPQSELSDISWVQTSGDSVTFLTPSSKGIAFTPTSAGSYTFEASFTTQSGNTETRVHELNVSNDTSSISARLGHVVSEGADVSLRASLNSTNISSDLTTNSIIWTQTSGPTVSFTDTTSGQTAVFFTAPDVDQDTFITFEVSASNNSASFTDNVAVLIENKNDISASAIFDERVSDTFVYNENSPYKNNLIDCLYSNELTVSNICTLNTLPLIAHDTTSPTVDDIMDRVVVSHAWMGDRFKEFLTAYDTNNDLKNMLRATTGIVISYDVRPSFYWAATGAIYLDANNFWLSVDERDTLNEAPDFRAEFGSDLQFDIPWRYVRNNDYLSTYISEETRRSRDSEEGVYSIISLLYHELAHANDYFPKSYWFNIDKSQKIIDAIPNTIQSEWLSHTYPLYGSEMRSLASVSFHGDSATALEKSYIPSDVTALFSVESAPQFYNYSSINEDYAMLFDGFMMKARYDIDRDVAITNYVGAGGYASDYIVDWGQRGRIGEENIKPRIAFVVERVLPEFDDYQTVIDNLPEPIQMESGKSWVDNLDISPSAAPKSLAKAQISSQTIKDNQERPINEFSSLFAEKPLPKK